MTKHENNNLATSTVFIDLFAGCGGLSLGLLQAGWSGLFAIEKDPLAFKTLKHNLIEDHSRFRFNWPDWLEKKEMPISRLLIKYQTELAQLKGKVDLIAGGPPCQGFSLAGRRNRKDPRNKLIYEYLKIVNIVSPKFLLLENVKGFDITFKNETTKRNNKSYAQSVNEKLTGYGYDVHARIINCGEHGVPQRRYRYFLLAIKQSEARKVKLNNQSPFEILDDTRDDFLLSKGLNPSRQINVQDAISDLRIKGKKMVPSIDSTVEGFVQVDYKPPKKLSSYQKLLRKDMVNGTSPTDLRLPKHNTFITERFQKILDRCEKGKTISKEDREHFGIKKRAITPLSPTKLSATITTLPEDIIHYSEPRVLTVRENARLQSFPDWYSFQGKYTTGGAMRKKECPRYTQVGNAVPPLLSEALGILILRLNSTK